VGGFEFYTVYVHTRDNRPKRNRYKLLMCTFDEVFGFKSAELMKCLQGRSLTQFATKNIGCFVYELNRESDYTDKNNVLLFVQAVFSYTIFFIVHQSSITCCMISVPPWNFEKIPLSVFKKMLTIFNFSIEMKHRDAHWPRR